MGDGQALNWGPVENRHLRWGLSIAGGATTFVIDNAVVLTFGRKSRGASNDTRLPVTSDRYNIRGYC